MAGTLTISTLSDGTNSTSSTNPIKGSAKAWVQFGVSGGTVTINQSFNCSSVTRTTNGFFTYNFSTALSNTGYVPVGSSGGTGALNSGAVSVFQNPSTGAITAPTTSAFIFATLSVNGSNFDPTYVNVAVFSY